MTSAPEGGGGTPKADERKRGCVIVTVTRQGGRGSKNQKILQTSFKYCQSPLSNMFEVHFAFARSSNAPTLLCATVTLPFLSPLMTNNNNVRKFSCGGRYTNDPPSFFPSSLNKNKHYENDPECFAGRGLPYMTSTISFNVYPISITFNPLNRSAWTSYVEVP